MRGTMKGFRSAGHEVLPAIGGDLMQPSRTGGEALAQHGGWRQSFKRMLPDTLRLLLRDGRYYKRGLALASRTHRLAACFEPHVIYERSAYMSAPGIKLARSWRIPLFFESDGCIVSTFAASYGAACVPLAELLEKRKAASAARIVVMSASAIPYIASKYFQPKKKFVVKSLGVDPEAFHVDRGVARQLAEERRLEGRFVVGFAAAQLQRYHGLDLLLRAAKRLQESHKDICFFIVGGGALMEQLVQMAKSEGLANCVYAGLVEKDMIATYMSLFDVGVVPDCVPHMFGIKVLEYGLLGLCPLAPDYPAFKGLFDFHGKERVLFNAGDVNALVERITWLAENPSETNALGQGWRTQVMRQFRWEETVKPVLEAMEEERLRRR
jgi:glycosyltransferase involved in cell wall biosynthesis